jgi:predicted  nucleic acid-binding Zn-ribbon protein
VGNKKNHKQFSLLPKLITEQKELGALKIKIIEKEKQIKLMEERHDEIGDELHNKKGTEDYKALRNMYSDIEKNLEKKMKQLKSYKASLAKI